MANNFVLGLLYKNDGARFETIKIGVPGPVVLHGIGSGGRDLSWQKWSYQVSLKHQEHFLFVCFFLRPMLIGLNYKHLRPACAHMLDYHFLKMSYLFAPTWVFEVKKSIL